MQQSQKNISKLMKMREEINSAKIRLSELDGERKAGMKRLQEEFGCPDVRKARKKLEKLEGDLVSKEKELADGVAALERDYEWRN